MVKTMITDDDYIKHLRALLSNYKTRLLLMKNGEDKGFALLIRMKHLKNHIAILEKTIKNYDS